MIHYLNSLLSENLAYAISWTVLHTLWQASLIALIMSWFLNRYKNENAIIRYRIAYAALLFVFGAALVTFFSYYLFDKGSQETALIPDLTIHLSGELPETSTHVVSQLGFWISHNLDIVASMWLLGVALFCVKLAGAYLYTLNLKKRNTDFLPDQVYDGFIKLKTTLGIRDYVHLAETSKVNTPMLIGYLKPVILFPVGLINQLTLEETNAILAHELAHIKRCDFLHNLILSVVELLFYYHPAVWWISANVRLERENCCDDLAMQLIGDKTIYAKTLLKIEELKTSQIPSLAIPLSRNRNQLLNRIARIVNQPQTRSQIREKLIATCLLFTFFFGFGNTILDDHKIVNIEVPDIEKKTITVLKPDCDKQIPFTLKTNIFDKTDCNCDNKNKQAVNVKVNRKVSDHRKITYIDTIPSSKKSNMTIINSSEEQEVVLKMKDGKIIELKIDGKEVEEENYDEHLDVDSYELPDLQIILEEAEEEIKKQLKDVEKDVIQFHIDLDELDMERENNPDKLSYENKPYFEDDEKNLSLLFEGDVENIFNNKLEGFQHAPIKLLDQFGHLKNIDSLLGTLDHFEGIVEYDSSLPHFKMHEFDFPSAQGFEFHHDGTLSNLGAINPTDKLMQALSDDGFLKTGESNKIELSGKHLKINGNKQPKNIYNKYRKIYEESVGHALSKDSKIKLEYHYQIREDKLSKRRNHTRI